jgi:hypothetical protein
MLRYQTKIHPENSGQDVNPRHTRPGGFVPVGLFFAFGSTAAAYAAITLLFPGTPLDLLWALNKPGHAGLLGLGRVGALLFVILSATLAATATGWFRRRAWAWVLGIAIISVNAVADAVNVLRGEPKTAIGVVVAGLLLFYLTRRGVREYFGP